MTLKTSAAPEYAALKKKRDRSEDVFQPPAVEAAAELHLTNTCQKALLRQRTRRPMALFCAGWPIFSVSQCVPSSWEVHPSLGKRKGDGAQARNQLGHACSVPQRHCTPCPALDKPHEPKDGQCV